MTTGWNRWRLHGAWCDQPRKHTKDLNDTQGSSTETQPTDHQHNRLDTTNMTPPRYDQDTAKGLVTCISMESAETPPSHHRGTTEATGTPWRHYRETIKRAQRHADTFQTPPRDYQDITRHHQNTTETPARHHHQAPPRHHLETTDHRDTTKTLPKHHRDTGTHPAQAGNPKLSPDSPNGGSTHGKTQNSLAAQLRFWSSCFAGPFTRSSVHISSRWSNKALAFATHWAVPNNLTWLVSRCKWRRHPVSLWIKFRPPKPFRVLCSSYHTAAESSFTGPRRSSTSRWATWTPSAGPEISTTPSSLLSFSEVPLGHFAWMSRSRPRQRGLWAILTACSLNGICTVITSLLVIMFDCQAQGASKQLAVSLGTVHCTLLKLKPKRLVFSKYNQRFASLDSFDISTFIPFSLTSNIEKPWKNHRKPPFSTQH